MGLPADFSPWEHLLEQVMNAHNAEVNRQIPPTLDPHGNIVETIGTVSGSMRVASLVLADDSAPMVCIRLMLFYFAYRAAILPPQYVMPVSTYQDNIQLAPQIHLMFKQVPSEATPLYPPIEAQISFRLVKYTEKTLTRAIALDYANLIKEHFAIEKFNFTKGQLKYCYKDLPNGLDLRLFVSTEGEGERVVLHILKLLKGQVVEFDINKVSVVQHKKPYKPEPGLQLVYQKERLIPRSHPGGKVWFRWAELSMHALPKNIILCDATRRKASPLTWV
jgi:hypothetical protein